VDHGALGATATAEAAAARARVLRFFECSADARLTLRTQLAIIIGKSIFRKGFGTAPGLLVGCAIGTRYELRTRVRRAHALALTAVPAAALRQARRSWAPSRRACGVSAGLARASALAPPAAPAPALRLLRLRLLLTRALAPNARSCFAAAHMQSSYQLMARGRRCGLARVTRARHLSCQS
jgi:hypothetical protein